jgi:hypothetical protein
MEQTTEEIHEGLRERPTLWPAGGLFRRVMTSRNLRARILVLMALAFVIRLVAVLAIDDPHTVPRNLEESDAPGYYVLADHLLDGTGYRYAPGEAPTAKRTPGYPLFLAAIFRVSGRNLTAVRIVQCLIDVATVYLVFGLSLLLFGSGAAALLAALAYTVYFPAIQNTTYILPETTHAFFLVGAVTLAILAMRAGSYFLYAVAGIIFGVATMIRAGAYLVPVVLLAVGIVVTPWIGLDRGVGRVLGDRRSAGIGLVSWRGLLILVAAFAVTMFPWVVRNETALGRPVITSTLAGANLYKGNHVPTGGSYPWAADSLFTPDLKARTAKVSEVEKDRILRAEARRMILSHKAAVAIITLKKIPRLWLNIGIRGVPPRRTIALASAHIIILGLAVYALLGLTPDAQRLSFVPVTTVVFSTAMYLTGVCTVRLVYPLIPVVLPYSALGLARIGTRLGLGRKPER